MSEANPCTTWCIFKSTTDVVLWAGERSSFPGWRIEDDPAPVEGDPTRLDPGADRGNSGRIHELAVDSRIAFLDYLPPIDLAQPVSLLIQVLGHERARREQKVGREQVADHIGHPGRRISDVVPHLLERRAVPGIQIHLCGPLAELGREGRVVHQEARRRKRAKVGE